MTDALAAGIAGAAAREVARIRSLEERAGEYARASRAENTLRAYRSDLRDFEQWCTDHRQRSLPASPTTLTLYLTALAEAGARASTIQRRVSAISQAHQLAGDLPPPPRLDGARDVARHPPHPGHRARAEGAIVTAELRSLLAVTPADTLAGRRDRALLVLGFAGGLRRSELVSLDAEDVTETEDGLRIALKRSKTDQEGEERELGLPRGQQRPPARSAPCAPSGAPRASTPVPSSAPSAATTRSRPDGSPSSRSRWWSSAPAAAPAATPPSSPATRCAAASPPPPPPAAPRSGRSCAREAGTPRRWCAATSAPARCSRRTRPRTLGL
jgi:hypothetical protein